MKFLELIAPGAGILYFAGAILEAIFPTASPFFLFLFELLRILGLSVMGCYIYEDLRETYKEEHPEETPDEPFEFTDDQNEN